MLRRLRATKHFHIGLMFHDAAARRGAVRVQLDQPLHLAPDEGVEYTVARLADKVDQLAARLAAAGIQPRQRVAIYKTNSFDIALLACALARLVAVPALLSPDLDAIVVSKLLRRLDNPWLITDGDKLDEVWDGTTPAEPIRGVLLSAGHDRPGATALDTFPDAPRREPVLLGGREPALITHSSGTTGLPKLVVHCPNTLWHRLLPQKLMAWPIRGREPVGFCMTFVHSRFYHALRVFLDYGNPLVIAVNHAPDAIGPLFVRTRPGYVETHPNTYIEWEDLAYAPNAPLASIRIFGGTFDAMHPRTIQRLLAASRRTNPVFVQLYGQSETGPVTARWYTRRSASKDNARCVGIPLPGFTRLRVVGPDGKSVKRGETGHLEAKLRSRVLTYFGEEERYAEELNGEWWRMGDMGFRGRWGLVYLLDREIDQIESMPSNLEAEDILMSRLEELREVAIVKGADGSAVPVVCTRGERPLDMARWRKATEDLDPMSDPVQIPFDDVPRTSTWKVRRPELGHLLQESR